MYDIVLFQSSDFPHTQSRILLSVTIAELYPFVDHSVLCIPYEEQLCVYEARNLKCQN